MCPAGGGRGQAAGGREGPEDAVAGAGERPAGAGEPLQAEEPGESELRPPPLSSAHQEASKAAFVHPPTLPEHGWRLLSLGVPSD